MLTIHIQSTAHYQDRISIDEVEYLIRLDYYTRLESWYMSISDTDGNILTRTRKLTVGWNPMVRDKAEVLPTGVFYVSSTIDPVGKNGFTDGSASLVYFDEEEAAELALSADTAEDLIIEAA